MAFDTVILALIIGTLFAIVYSMRVLVILERRIARMDYNIERITSRVEKEEREILKEQKKIESEILEKKKSKK